MFILLQSNTVIPKHRGKTQDHAGTYKTCCRGLWGHEKQDMCACCAPAWPPPQTLMQVDPCVVLYCVVIFLPSCCVALGCLVLLLFSVCGSNGECVFVFVFFPYCVCVMTFWLRLGYYDWSAMFRSWNLVTMVVFLSWFWYIIHRAALRVLNTYMIRELAVRGGGKRSEKCNY